jgi:S-adenosylmethionine decarboxylase
VPVWHQARELPLGYTGLVQVPTVGRHVLVELFGCEASLLDEMAVVRQALLGAVGAIGATVVGEAFHRFSPQGVSGVLLIAESHLSCHTWPEAGYVAVDIYTCGVVDPRGAVEHLRRAFRARSWLVEDIVRGLVAHAPESPIERRLALFDRRRPRGREVFLTTGIVEVTETDALEDIAGEPFPAEVERITGEPEGGWRWGRHRYALVEVVEGTVLVQCVPHTRRDDPVLRVLTERSIDTWVFAAGQRYLLRADTTLHHVVPQGRATLSETRWTLADPSIAERRTGAAG